MKVLHVLGSNKLSGAENVVVEIINMFRNEVDMAYLSPKGDIEKSLYSRNIRFISVENLSTSELNRSIKEYQPDIIHAHDIRATIQAVRCRRDIPVISHIHGNHDDMKVIGIKSILYLIHSYKAKHIIAVSDSVIKQYAFSKYISNKCTVLYNTIDKDRVLAKVHEDKREYKFDFVFLGRLSEPKNPQRVAKVASCVLKKLPDSKFGIIGEGNFRKDMEGVFVSEDVIDRVIFCGYMDNPYKALSQAKVMVMCSKYEGTPIAALEAMILGIPIVSTPTDGMKDIVINSENGFISSEDDEIVNYLCRLIEDESLNSKLSAGAIKSIERFTDVDRYKNRIMSIYDKVTTSMAFQN